MKRSNLFVRTVFGGALLCAVLVAPRTSFADEAYLATLVERAAQSKLHEERQWHTLLHYTRRLLVGHKSEADGDRFFLSPNGKKDPRAELEATLRAFFNPPIDEKVEREKEGEDPANKPQHPQCQFPARYSWLKARLGFDSKKLPEQKCPRFESFRERVDAVSATLVFSSYYLNNPASAFGHTFLRLNRKLPPKQLESERLDLLDYGINYAAVVTTPNALLYAVYGVFGLFQGTFTSVPYYYKVREYSDFESRDLWEYQLALTAPEVKLLVEHLWELGSTYFDYYYLDENCSYHILALLEVARPSLKLLDELKAVVVPVDTVRAAVDVPGLVPSVRFRPSLRREFEVRKARLTPYQLTLLKTVIDAKDPAALSDEEAVRSRAEILDSAIDYMDYRYGKKMFDKSVPEAQIKQKYLVARASLDHISEPLKIETPEIETPHAGHRSSRLMAQVGHRDAVGGYTLLGYRFALHDLKDSLTGYPAGSSIEFADIRGSYNWSRESVRLERFDLVSVASLGAWSELDRPLSFRFRAGSGTVRNTVCDECYAGKLEAGAGLTMGLPRVALSILGEFEGFASPGMARSKWALALGPSAWFRVQLGQLNFLMKAGYRYVPWGRIEDYAFGEAGIRWGITMKHAVGLETRRENLTSSKEGWGGLVEYLYYF